MKKNSEKLYRWFESGDDLLENINECSEDIQKEAPDVKRRKKKLMEWMIASQEYKGIERFEMKSFERIYAAVSVIMCAVLISVLLITVSYLPRHGDEYSPDNNEVSERYLEKGSEETGATNMVAGMILDYRAFDTLGESCVLFTAVSCVFILMKKSKASKKNAETEDEDDDKLFDITADPILHAVATLLVPLILLFGVYVVLNGHLSPGGGFSGGAIMGAGLILHSLAFGFEKTEKFFSMKTFKVITTSALVFYALSKSYSFFMGANHLESGIPKGTLGNIISSGLILPLNICVGLVVACTMYGFYSVFKKGDI